MRTPVVLVEAHNPLLALITVLGVAGVEPLPDADFKLPFLRHCGVSHSLFAAVSVGSIIAVCGWVVGVQVSTVLGAGLSANSEVVTTGATTLQSVAPPDTTGSVVAWIVGLLNQVAGILKWTGRQSQGLTRQTAVGVGFVIGRAGSVCICLAT